MGKDLLFTDVSIQQKHVIIPSHRLEYTLSRSIGFEHVFDGDAYTHQVLFRHSVITIYAVMSHTHDHGTRVILTHIKRTPSKAFNNHKIKVGQKRIEPLVFFDSKPNTMLTLDHVVRMRYGDSLRLSCTYDNPTSNELRYGNNPQSEEMCQVFLVAYVRRSGK